MKHSGIVRVCLWSLVLVGMMSSCSVRAGQMPVLDLQRVLDDAVRGGRPVVTLPPGRHRVKSAEAGHSYHATVSKANGLEIVGAGTILVFENPKQGGILFERCQKVTIRDLTLDWDPLPFTQGQVVRLGDDGASYDVRVETGYADDPVLYSGKVDVVLYDAATRHPKRGAWDMFGATVSHVAQGILRVKLRSGQTTRDMGVAQGDLAGLMAVRKKMALRFVDCGGMTVNQVTVWAAPGMALQEALGEGDSHYTYTVTPGPAPTGGLSRLLSSTADAFHSSSVRKGPRVEQCRFEGQGDDGVAIHGAYCLVTSAGESSTLVCAPKYSEMPYRRGDPVRWYDGRTFRLKGEAKIERVIRTDPPSGAAQKTVQELWTRYRDDGADKRYYALTLDHPVRTDIGDLLCSPACSGNGFTVRNTMVRHHRGRGMLIKASDGIIEDNQVEDTTHAGIALGPEFSQWLEGDYVRNVTVRNNVLRDVGIGANCMRNERSILAGAITVGASTPDRTLPDEPGNRNLVIEGNHVESTGGIGLLIACAQDVLVKSNRIGATRILGVMGGGVAYGVVPDASVFVTSSSRIRFEANQISGRGIVLGTNVVEIAR